MFPLHNNKPVEFLAAGAEYDNTRCGRTLKLISVQTVYNKLPIMTNRLSLINDLICFKSINYRFYQQKLSFAYLSKKLL